MYAGSGDLTSGGASQPSALNSLGAGAPGMDHEARAAHHGDGVGAGAAGSAAGSAGGGVGGAGGSGGPGGMHSNSGHGGSHVAGLGNVVLLFLTCYFDLTRST